MVQTASTMLELGTKAPDFSLPDVVTNKNVSPRDFSGRPLLVIFMCNHCPFVKHLREKLAERTKAYMEQGVGVVGISSNDVSTHPDDHPDKMKQEARDANYGFPYLYDESQDTAKAYRAACTPDFFLFDKDHKLAYRGQFDDSRPGNGVPVTGKDLTAAVNLVLAGKSPSREQTPSIGCNIKWKAGNEPDYFPTA